MLSAEKHSKISTLEIVRANPSQADNFVRLLNMASLALLPGEPSKIPKDTCSSAMTGIGSITTIYSSMM
jgi:hypothetical protein